MAVKTIYMTDDTDFGGDYFRKLKVINPQKRKLSKVLFVVNGGDIIKTFTDENNFQYEEMDLIINFSSKETAKLKHINIGKLRVYDMDNKQRTCEQDYVFYAESDVIKKKVR